MAHLTVEVAERPVKASAVAAAPKPRRRTKKAAE
jgi:hypothetical protein